MQNSSVVIKSICFVLFQYIKCNIDCFINWMTSNYKKKKKPNVSNWAKLGNIFLIIIFYYYFFLIKIY